MREGAPKPTSATEKTGQLERLRLHQDDDDALFYWVGFEREPLLSRDNKGLSVFINNIVNLERSDDLYDRDTLFKIALELREAGIPLSRMAQWHKESKNLAFFSDAENKADTMRGWWREIKDIKSMEDEHDRYQARNRVVKTMAETLRNREESLG